MIYDLTHSISEDLPVYPGDPHVRIEPVGQIVKDGFSDRLVTIGTHNGTHIDAPAHMIEGGNQLKDYPVERFVRSAVCIDARNGFSVEAIAAAIDKPGVAVIFYTGASDYFEQEKYWQDYKVLDSAVARLLIDKQVSLVGVDTGSFDIEEDFPIHKQLLAADVLLLENLTNLQELIGKSFDIYALPLKLEADGSPTRVIAVV
jgi:arylformamidase